MVLLFHMTAANDADILVDREPCLYCRAGGGDRSGDNLAVYKDGHKHCYACGRHHHAPASIDRVRRLVEPVMPPNADDLQWPKDYLPLLDGGNQVAIQWLRKYGITNEQIVKYKF